MNDKVKTVSKLSVFWQLLVQPSKNISIERQRESYLLNRIALLFIQIIAVALSVITLFPTAFSYQGEFTALALALTMLILFSAFVINRIGYYYIAVWILFSSAHALIYYNANISKEPYIEVAYMALVPIVGILILDLKNTIILIGVTLTLFIIFQYTHASNIPREVAKDLSILISVMSILVIFVSHWRNKVEKETRELFLEQEKSDLIRELITNISHDFKTPLTIISSSLFLIEKSPDTDRQLYHIHKATNQVWRLEGYVQDMLEILHLEDRKIALQEQIDLNEMIRIVCEEFSGEIEKKNLYMTLNLDDTLSKLQSHRSNIFRMTQNLINNAIAYTLDDGEIHITTYERANNLYFVIKDTGIGMTEEESKLIFDRFYRVDKARSLATGGTGLGLSIVKRIIDINKGSISVDSKLNEGTTFTVILPIKPQ